ncbi:MAG TPA: mechanosensitive ion channel domain-containing protein [Telluria sp.]
MPLTNLLQDLIGDLRDPGILWQVAAIALCVVLGGGIAYLIRRTWLHSNTELSQIRRIGVESFGRVMGPLLIAGLLALAKFLLAPYQHVNLLRIALPLFISLAVIRFGFYMLRRVFARHGQVGAALLTFEKIFALLVWIGVALYITGLWPGVLGFLEGTKLPLGKYRPSLADILQGSVSIVVLMILALWAGAALEERLMGLQSMHTSLRVVMARMSRALLILVAVLLTLPLVGLDLTVLSVFGGAFGVGLGLGMQRIASNYVSGFIILLERSLSIGDPINIDKYSGKVERINTRYTILKGLDGTQTLLPNEMLITGVVQNQSSTNRAVRTSSKIMIAYGSELETVIPLLQAQAAGVARVQDTPAPDVLLNAFHADGYELELGFWVGDPENGLGGVTSEVNKRIYALVKSGQIKLGHPANKLAQLDAHIASEAARIAQSRPI